MKKIHVLVADDEERYLYTTAKLLNKLGYQVTMARDGIEALTTASREQVDVIVLDMMMPGMDGLDVLKSIKKRSPQTEVIMLTGHATVDAIADGMKTGAFDFIIKPVQIGDLVAKIDEAYSKLKRAARRMPETSKLEIKEPVR